MIKGNGMKKALVLFLTIMVFASLPLAGEAAVFQADSPFTFDFLRTVTNINDFGDHAVISFNDGDQSALATVLDFEGFPVQTSESFGWFYLFADFFTDGSFDLYGSDTGFYDDWHFLGNFR